MLPGIPSNPTKTAVIIFNPIWNEYASPTKFIISIIIPPKTELSINLNIIFNGTINILHIKNTNIIPAMYATNVLGCKLITSN